MGGVEAADVEGRIGLRIAEPLRLLEAFRERQTLLVHAGEDVVAGAVEDAVDAGDAAAAEPLAQRLDDRDAARDRRLEAERRVMRLGQPGERNAMARQQRLVGGDHAAAEAERRLDRALGRIALPAHQLDEHVDAAIARERDRIGDLAHLGQVERGVLGRVLGRIGHQLDAAAGALRERGARARQHRGHGRADRAQAGEAHSERFGHGAIREESLRSAAFGKRNDVVQLFRRAFKEAPDVAGGLADALLVLDQRDAHITLAVFAEADAGRDRDLGLLDQERGELDAADASRTAPGSAPRRTWRRAAPAPASRRGRRNPPARRAGACRSRASRRCSRPGR